MQTIKFSDLVQRSERALKALHTAATADGFFMLEFDSKEDADVLSLMKYMEDFAKRVLATPPEVRKEYRTSDLGPLRLSGFKEIGTVEGAKKGQPDGFEMYMIRQDELLSDISDTELRCPPLVKSERKSLSKCLEKYAGLSELILTNLSDVLGLDSTILLGHDMQAPSATNFSFIRYPPQPDNKERCGHIAHTDVGSLTILSTTERGLQVIDNETENWTYIDIQPTSLCVQFGDALKYLSGGTVVPSLHRVLPPDDQGRQVTKYSMVYFLRPNLTTELTREDGETCQYQEYHCNKFGAFMGNKRDVLSARQHKVLADGVS